MENGEDRFDICVRSWRGRGVEVVRSYEGKEVERECVLAIVFPPKDSVTMLASLTTASRPYLNTFQSKQRNALKS
jgi:hypothetical protein